MVKSVSVIIPAYNSQATIATCLQSLSRQSLKPKEIIVVDGGSRDGTAETAKRFSVRLFRRPHQGPGLSRNFGAHHATGDILVFVDADMEFDRQFLKFLTRPISSGKARGTWSGNEWVKNWYHHWARCANFYHWRGSNKMVGESTGQKEVFRAILKKDFDRAGGFTPTGYTDDWTLADKLGFVPYRTPAKFFHSHPETITKIFSHAVWVGKRPYKLGSWGAIWAAFRANAVFSLVWGSLKAVRFVEARMVIYQLVYDLGLLIGALISLTGRRY